MDFTVQNFFFITLNITLLFSILNSENQFGYISYSTTNLGDDIQAIAAKRFLPENSIGIERELIGQFTHTSKVKTIVNGWYMHTKDIEWYLDIPPPKKSWPPSAAIDPLFISIFLAEKFLPTALSAEGVEYLKNHAPIGARDFSTLHELEKRGIPSYFSGCLSLTLDNPYTERNDIIYVVDIDKECIDYIKRKTKSTVKVLSHRSMRLNFLSNEERLNYAESFLEKYRKAKCVITERFHVSMPCLALKTPVLLIHPKDDRRFNGKRELLHACTKEELLSGKVEYDFDNPPENSDAYLPLRENLIKTVTDWVNNNS